MTIASLPPPHLESTLVRDLAHGVADLFPLLPLGAQPQCDFPQECALENEDALLGDLKLGEALGKIVDASDVGSEGSERVIEGVGHVARVGRIWHSLKMWLDNTRWELDSKEGAHLTSDQQVLKFNLENLPGAHSYRTQSAGTPTTEDGPDTATPTSQAGPNHQVL